MYTGDLIDYCARVCGYKNEYATDSTLIRLTFTLGIQVNRKEFQWTQTHIRIYMKVQNKECFVLVLEGAYNR